MLATLKNFVTLNKIYFLIGTGILIVALLGAVTIQSLRVDSLKSKLETSKQIIDSQTTVIEELEKTQKKILEVTSVLSKKQKVSVAQKTKNQRELDTVLQSNGMTAVFKERLRCLELASGAQINSSELPNNTCPHLFQK